MFGYITINKDELKIRDYHTYRGYYCGLCRALGSRYGQLSRLTLTYDMTFLIVLLTGLYESQTSESQKRCLLHPGSRHLTLQNEFTEYAADMNILLTYYNLQDDWTDEKKLSSLTMAAALKKSCSSITNRYPAQAAAIKQYMERLSACEKAQVTELDTAAGYTGEMLGEIFACRDDEWADSLRKIGFYLGKLIYLYDAFEDLYKDAETGNYNPLLAHRAAPDFDENIHQILMMMAAECAREFEKLPILTNVDILRNILYSGLWSRYEMIIKKRREQNKNHDQ